MNGIQFPGTTSTVNGVELHSTALSVHFDGETFEGDVADPTWAFTDASGHFHAYDGDGKLPTLRRLPIAKDCDGTCGDICQGDGYTAWAYQCILCDEFIEPRTRRGFQRLGTTSRKVAEVTGPRTLVEFDGEVVSFVCAAGFGFGILHLLGVTMSDDGDHVTAEIALRVLYRRYGTQMQQTVREPRANLTSAILAGAKAVREPWESLSEESRAEFLRDFATLAAARAITAALPLLGLDADGEILP